MPEHQPSYQIRRTEEFIQKSADLGKIYSRMSELIQAIDWALCRKPHHYKNLADNYYLWVTDELAPEGFPSLKILYRINEEEKTVILMAIDD